MTDAAALDYRGSGMNRFLEQLDIADEPVSPARFSGRLVELIDLAHSIKISLAHSGMKSLECGPNDSSVDLAANEFRRAHGEMIEIIVQSFSTESGGSRLKTPRPEALRNDDGKAALKPFINFYVYYQRMMESKISHLRTYIRDAAMELSVSLSQLARLDEVLGDTLALQQRKSLALVPQQLEQRFGMQLQQAGNQTQADHEQLKELHASFCRDMQALLLAELEVRLLPVLGLVEAMEAESQKTKTEDDFTLYE